MPDKIQESANKNTGRVSFADDLLKLSRALTIAEIERFYENVEPIAFEVTDAQ